MKKVAVLSVTLVAVAVGVGLYLFLGGAYGRISIPGPSHRFSDPIGRAYYCREPGAAYDVNLERLLPYLKDADWSSDHWSLWKIPFIVVFRNGQKIKIDRLGGQYAIDGIPGVFSVTGLTREQQEVFGSELNAVLKEEPNQALLPTTTAVTPRAGHESSQP